jgi:hypothetical protein
VILLGDVFVILIALAALASTPDAAGPQVIADDPMVCKADKNADLGSNIRKRKKTCMRASEWKYLETMNEQAKRKVFNGPSVNGAPPSAAVGGQ